MKHTIAMRVNGNIESVQYVVGLGFTEEQAMQAYQIVGDDPEIMLDFLLNIS